MARKRNESRSLQDDKSSFPPERVIRLLHGLRAAISLAEARSVSFEDLEWLSGRPVGTIASWFDGSRMSQLEFLFSLLERLPERLRSQLLNSTCRIQPTLHHSALAHDPIAVSQLEALLRQRVGITIIRGAPEHARAFALAALGNSTRQINNGQQLVLGVEFQAVPAWTPVPGIVRMSPNAKIVPEFQRAWSRVQTASNGSLILLGGIWNRVPDLHSEIVHLAGRCHVIIADDMPKADGLARTSDLPVHVITVSAVHERPEWIRVTLQTR